jgi:phosphonate transport system ATP-binding protein
LSLLVSLEDQSFKYGDRVVLQNISITIETGEKIALLGRSGAGKSTLLTQLYSLASRNQLVVALVPQDDALVPTLSVYHNIYMGRLDRHGAAYNLANLVYPRACDIAAVTRVATTVGLADCLWQPVASLSGGQKQRTAVGRALYRAGPIILADEPVSSVDVTQGAAILAALGAQFETAIVALHDVDLALGFASRLIGLRAGQIVFDGQTSVISRGQIDELYAA